MPSSVNDSVYCVHGPIGGDYERSEDDYERTFGGKTISVGLAIKVIPVVELAATPEIEVYEEVAALLDSNEVRHGSCGYVCRVRVS